MHTPLSEFKVGVTWCVAPGLIVGGENPKMAPSNKLAVVHAKQGISWGEELGMKDNLEWVG